jgi:hypothetical protein
MAYMMFDVKFSLWHSVYLRVIDLYRRGRRRAKDAAPRADTRAPGSGFISGTRWILLRIGSQCRKLHPNYQDHLRYPDCEIHPPTFGWGIELVHIGIDP